MAENRDETNLARQLTNLVSLKVPTSNGGRSIFSKGPENFQVSLIDLDSESFVSYIRKLEQEISSTAFQHIQRALRSRT